MSISTPPLTISHTSTPSMRACLSARFAFASSSSYAARTSFGDATPTRTRPASLLCSKSGDDTFITTGKPIALAAFTAAAAEAHSSSLLVLMPYAFRTCFEFHSESASPGFRPSRSLRAFLAAGRGVVGASANGERYRATNVQ